MTSTKYVKIRAEDYEFMKSLLYLCHDLMETITNSALTPAQADKMREKLQATERLYFEARKGGLHNRTAKIDGEKQAVI